MAKVYLVYVSDEYLLESGETFVTASVSDVFSSYESAEEYTLYLGQKVTCQYFIKEVFVKN